VDMIFEPTDYTDFAAKEIGGLRKVWNPTRSVDRNLAVAFKPRPIGTKDISSRLRRLSVNPRYATRLSGSIFLPALEGRAKLTSSLRDGPYRHHSLWAWQATLFSYRASEKSRIAVLGPAENWVSTSGRGWRVLIYLFLSLPADAFSRVYS
jgi:hypothetical protein